MKKLNKQIKHLSTLLVVVTGIIIFLGACAKNCRESALENVSITENIKSIIIEGPWDVTVNQADTDNSATLEYCSCAKKYISAKMLANGCLHIKVSFSGNINCKVLKANIKAKSLEKVEASGAASIRTYGRFTSLHEIALSGASKLNGMESEGDVAKIELSGASSLKAFSFVGNEFDADISGASNINLDHVLIDFCKVNCSGASTFEGTGFAAEGSYTASGASHIKTFDLELNNLYINLSGASFADVTVNNKITGSVIGASTLRYKRAIDTNGVYVDISSKMIRYE